MATNIRRFGSVAAALAAVSLGLATAVKAQDFPQRPITFVVGLGAGGGQDINSQIYADAMSRGLGQRVVVDNKTGAGGGVGASYVQNAAPDGYTLLTVSGLQHVYVPATQPGLYAPLKGFAPVSLMFEIISALTVPEDMPVQNAAEFIAYGRRKPGGFTVGAPGPGSPPHMFGALIGETTGVPVQVIQYRGSSQAMTDLAGGRIDMAFPTVRAGRAVHRREEGQADRSRRRQTLEPIPGPSDTGGGGSGQAHGRHVVWPAGDGRHARAGHRQAQRSGRESVARSGPDSTHDRAGNSVRISAPDEMRILITGESDECRIVVGRLGLHPQ